MKVVGTLSLSESHLCSTLKEAISSPVVPKLSQVVPLNGIGGRVSTLTHHLHLLSD
jgi:creatinine amidohydrolase/Fe(II)-dependent formamide hydrolase-like protein